MRKILDGLALSCSVALVLTGCTTGGEAYLASIDGGDVDASDALGLVLDGVPAELAELGEARIIVRLNRSPTTVYPIRLETSAELALDLSSFNLGPDNWETGQIVRLTSRDDDDARSHDAQVTARADGLTDLVRSIRVVDNDPLTFEIDRMGEISIDETRTAIVRARLTARPEAEVVLDVHSPDAAIVADTATLRFTTDSWHDYQPITLRAPEDVNTVSEVVQVELRDRASAIPPRPVSTRAIDKDSLQIATSPEDEINVVEQGGPIQLRVRLNRLPTATTVVTVRTTSSAIRLNGNSDTTVELTTSNWNTGVDVPVTAVMDDDTAPATGSIELTATTPAGMLRRTVGFQAADDDRQEILETAPMRLAVQEGEDSRFVVTLQWRPTGTVQVTARTGNANVAECDQVLTFDATNYNNPTGHEVVVHGHPDDNLAPGTTTITLAGGGAQTNVVIPVDVTDDDRQVIEVETDPVAVTEGMNANIRVRLRFEPLTQSVSVTGTSSSAKVTTQAQAVSWTNLDYRTYKNFVVTGAPDSDGDPEQATVTLSGATAPTPREVRVNVTDPTMEEFIGYRAPFGGTVDVPGDEILAYKVTLSATSRLDFFAINKGVGANFSAKMALYSHRTADDRPGNPIVFDNAGASLANGGIIQIPVDDPQVPAGTYWLAIRFSGDTTAVGSTAVGDRKFRCDRFQSFVDAWPTTANATDWSCGTSGVINVFARMFR